MLNTGQHLLKQPIQSGLVQGYKEYNGMKTKQDSLFLLTTTVGGKKQVETGRKAECIQVWTY
jgi:hypothetical protein